MMGMFIATDTGSTNGLAVNGKKVRRASLKDGDVLQLGDVVLRIDCGK
jgi:pSer/pThr/pTyr-binding forkhead associated (FHA) protein